MTFYCKSLDVRVDARDMGKAARAPQQFTFLLAYAEHLRTPITLLVVPNTLHASKRRASTSSGRSEYHFCALFLRCCWAALPEFSGCRLPNSKLLGSILG